jgi:hypothetical protein
MIRGTGLGDEAPNRSPNRWRRVLVICYLTADGKMGANEYPDFRMGEPFSRQFILLRGDDIAGRGLIPVEKFRATFE